MRALRRPLLLLAALASSACAPPGADDTDTAGEELGEPICGDAKVDPPEACDDGNTQPNDGCSAACELPGTPAQCVTLIRGDGASVDRVDVVLPSDDSFVAAGSLNMNGADVAWIGQWSEPGEQRWLTTLAAQDDDTQLRDATTDGAGGYWVALNSSGLAELAQLDEAGDVLDRRSFPDASLRRIRSIEGRLWAAGSFQGDLWVAVLEGGALETLLLEDHLGFADSVTAMEVDRERVLVAATLATSSGFDGDVMQTPTSEIVVIAFDFAGNELEREALNVGSLATPNASAVRGIADRWVVAGHAPPVEAVLQRPQVWIADAEHGWTWNSLATFGPQMGATPQGGASLGGIVVVETGVVLVGASYTNDGPAAALQASAWSMEFDDAGQLVWEYHATDPSESYYQETAVATDANGRIRTAGVGRTDGVSSTLRSCLMERPRFARARQLSDHPGRGHDHDDAQAQPPGHRAAPR